MSGRNCASDFAETVELFGFFFEPVWPRFDQRIAPREYSSFRKTDSEITFFVNFVSFRHFFSLRIQLSKNIHFLKFLRLEKKVPARGEKFSFVRKEVYVF